MNIHNDASHIVSEYALRKQLRGLGYTFDADGLSSFKAISFVIIGDEIAKIDNERLKKK